MSTARDMVEMLRRHYLPEGRLPAGIFAPEIQAPGVHRRADLIWQGVTNASQDELIGHEIKVSRADVLVELEDPTKSDAWQRYCDRWWLVVLDPRLVDGLTIPPSWGVMAPPSGRRTRSMTVVVEAPRLKPVDKAPAYATIGKWLHWRMNEVSTQSRRYEQDADRLREINRRLQESEVRESPERALHERVVSEIVTKLGGAHSGDKVGSWESHVHVNDVVAALRDLGTIYAHGRDIGYEVDGTVRELRRILGRIDEKQVAELAGAVKRFTQPAGVGITDVRQDGAA